MSTFFCHFFKNFLWAPPKTNHFKDKMNTFWRASNSGKTCLDNRTGSAFYWREPLATCLKTNCSIELVMPHSPLRTGGRADGRSDERTGGRADGRTDGRTGGRADGRADGRTIAKSCLGDASLASLRSARSANNMRELCVSYVWAMRAQCVSYIREY